MPNSSIIKKAKNKIIKEFIKDADIIEAINSNKITKPEELINTHIFDYNQNPHTLNEVGTFITIQVHIPETYHNDYKSSIARVKPLVEIWIISHERHMAVDNVPKVTQNRNDYLSELIDNKINGKTGIGIGETILLSNIEGSSQQDYLYRKMLFRCIDLNWSLCEEG